MTQSKKKKIIVIIGGGFGGFYSALELQKKKNFKTILIDPSNFFVYKPLIHEVCIGEIPENSIKIYYKRILINTLVIKSKVIEINFLKNKILLDKKDKSIIYDYLLICPGAKSSDLIEGSKNTLSLHNIIDAKKIKNSLIHERKKENLIISVIGEGLTGIELTGQLASLITKWNKNTILHQFLYFPRYMMDKHLLDEIVKKRMEKLKVIVHPSERVIQIKDNSVVTIKDIYHSDIVITCTGIQPNIIGTDLKFNNGYEVNNYCQLKNHDNVYAIGDVARFYYNEKPAPALAQIALKESKYVVKDIKRRERLSRRKPFKPKILAIVVSIGKHYAIGEFLGYYRIKGIFPWFIKRFYYFFQIFYLKKDWRLPLVFIKSSLFINNYLYNK